jgi:hypothetical protein
MRLSSYMATDPTRRDLLVFVKARVSEPMHVASTPWAGNYGSFEAFDRGWVPLANSDSAYISATPLKIKAKQRELYEIVRELRG